MKYTHCNGFKPLSWNIKVPKGSPGPPGANGTNGTNGAPGPPGPGGLAGTFYSIEEYTGTIGVGAIATAACDPTDATNSQKYVAISGGVQNTDSGTNMTTNTSPVHVTASFPGRMNFTTFTPIPGRLDGWIIQFGHTGTQDTNLVVWALCIPLANVGGVIPIVAHQTTVGGSP